MAWTDFDLSLPDETDPGGGPTFAQQIRDNLHAIWNFIMMGAVKGMAFSVSGGTAEEPGTIELSNGTNRLKGVITWGSAGGADGNLSQIVWSVSQDNGSNYSAVATQTFSYDSSGNLTATTNAGGLLSFIAYLLGRVKSQDADITTLNGLIAAFGDMAGQDSTNVAITGGFVKGATIGGTGASEAPPATIKTIREKVVDLGAGTPANTFTIDWNAGDVFLCAPGANFTFAETNAPANGFKQEAMLIVTGASGFTATLPAGYSWGSAGAPTWTAGPDIITVTRTGHASAPVKRFATKSLA